MSGSCRKKNNLINLNKFLRRPIAGCLIFLCLSSCGNIDSYKIKNFSNVEKTDLKRYAQDIDSIKEISKIIVTGDLITRTGNDFTSESLRSLNRRNKKYSHCGIAVVENDTVFVYHALGGDFNPDQKLLKEPLLTFANPIFNRGIGIFRFILKGDFKTQTKQTVIKYFNIGLPFDMAFDLNTDDKMYCAEFVAKSYIKSSKNELTFNKSNIESFNFYGVDDIFLNPHCVPIKELLYKH